MNDVNNKTRIIYGILFLIGAMFVTMVVFVFFTIKGMGNLSMKKPDMDSSIAVVEVNGAIFESKKIIKKLIKAEKMEKAKAIIVRIDSPGGAVGPTQEIYEEIIRIDQEKPVYASFGSVAASGGYYIGAAARKIFANKGTITGSIGVIMQFLDLSDVIKFLKLNPQTIKSGTYKDIGNPSRPLSEVERNLLNKTISRVHEQFRDDIIKRRKKRLKADLDELTQGQIFSGEEAKEFGLVDEIAGLWGAAKVIHDDLKLEGDFRDLHFIKDRKDLDILEILESIESPQSWLRQLYGTLNTVQLMYK